MTIFRCALFASLLLPQAAFAGPITWSYSSEVVFAQDYGTNFAVSLSPDDTITAMPGDVNSVPLFSSSGSARPEPGSYEANYDFDIKVRLTDVASGQSEVLTFAGGYSSHWTYQPGDDSDVWRWDYESSTFGDYWSPREAVLGTTRYTVRAYGGGSGQFPNGEMDVRAEALPVYPTTPEPGTLALAGIGIGTALVRLRRFKPSRG